MLAANVSRPGRPLHYIPDEESSAPYDSSMRIVRLGPGDEHFVFSGSDLFDHAPTEVWTTRFLSTEGHHLLVAVDDHDDPMGFVSGVETTHPDKGTEMFLYELGVGEAHRRKGVATALVEALKDLARERGNYGMWVLCDEDNEAAVKTYRKGRRQ